MPCDGFSLTIGATIVLLDGSSHPLVCVYLVLDQEIVVYCLLLTLEPYESSFRVLVLFIPGMMIRSTMNDNNNTSEWTLTRTSYVLYILLYPIVTFLAT